MRILSKNAQHPSWKQLLLFVILTLAIYTAVPLLAHFAPSLPLFLLDLVVINNFSALILCGFLALKCGFIWYLPILSALLFCPIVFIFYNSSALIYAALYLVFGFLGLTFGNIAYRIRQYHQS